MIRPYYEGPGVQIFHGDCRDVLPSLAGISTCLTDPPYGLGFMGKGWDHEVPGVEFWTAVSQALLPGGHLLAFGGTRLWHRLAVAIEDAGFEIRDTLMWLYGSGFPKSLDVSKAIDKAAGAERKVVKGGGRSNIGNGSRSNGRSNFSQVLVDPTNERTVKNDTSLPATDAAKEWDGWGTALKPAWEPILLARKPLDGTVAANVQAHGTGALNIDGCRIAGEMGPDRALGKPRINTDKYGAANSRLNPQSDLGRWPANLILDEAGAALLDEQSGELTSGANPERRGSAKFRTAYGDFAGQPECNPARGQDSGGASRFFYTSKASRAERNGGDAENDHPTVKPLDLMRWLARLTKSPNGGTVLDPFMGSGSTLVAAREEFRPVIGIDREERYCEISARRLSQGVLDFGGVA